MPINVNDILGGSPFSQKKAKPASSLADFKAAQPPRKSSLADFQAAQQAPQNQGSVLGDIGHGLAAGAANLAGAVGDVPNLLTAGAVPPLSPSLASFTEGQRAQYRPETQQAMQNIQQAEGFGGTLSAIAQNPVGAAQYVVESAPSFVPGLAAVTGASKVAKGAALAKGLTQQQAQQAAIRAGTKAAVGTNATLSGAFAGQQAAQGVREMPQEQLEALPDYQTMIAQGMAPEAAREALANRAGRYAGAVGAPLGAATGMVGAPIEARLAAGQAATLGGIASRIGATAGSQTLEEGLQEGAEQFAANVGQRRINPEQSLTEGVPESVALGGTLGAVAGGGLSGVGEIARLRQPQDDTADAAGNTADAVIPPTLGLPSPGRHRMDKAGSVVMPDGSVSNNPADVEAFVADFVQNVAPDAQEATAVDLRNAIYSGFFEKNSIDKFIERGQKTRRATYLNEPERPPIQGKGAVFEQGQRERTTQPQQVRQPVDIEGEFYEDPKVGGRGFEQQTQPPRRQQQRKLTAEKRNAVVEQVLEGEVLPSTNAENIHGILDALDSFEERVIDKAPEQLTQQAKALTNRATKLLAQESLSDNQRKRAEQDIARALLIHEDLQARGQDAPLALPAPEEAAAKGVDLAAIERAVFARRNPDGQRGFESPDRTAESAEPSPVQPDGQSTVAVGDANNDSATIPNQSAPQRASGDARKPDGGDVGAGQTGQLRPKTAQSAIAAYKQKNYDATAGSADNAAMSNWADGGLKDIAEQIEKGGWQKTDALTPRGRKTKNKQQIRNKALSDLRSIGFSDVAYDNEGNAYHAVAGTPLPAWLATIPDGLTERETDNFIANIPSRSGVEDVVSVNTESAPTKEWSKRTDAESYGRRRFGDLNEPYHIRQNENGTFSAVPGEQQEQAETAPDFESMVAEAARWRGAAIKAARGLTDKKAQLAHSRATTKGDLDAYLMRKFGIDEAEARSVSNALTANNIPADESANIDDFSQEPWYLALNKKEKANGVQEGQEGNIAAPKPEIKKSAVTSNNGWAKWRDERNARRDEELKAVTEKISAIAGGDSDKGVAILRKFRLMRDGESIQDFLERKAQQKSEYHKDGRKKRDTGIQEFSRKGFLGDDAKGEALRKSILAYLKKEKRNWENYLGEANDIARPIAPTTAKEQANEMQEEAPVDKRTNPEFRQTVESLPKKQRDAAIKATRKFKPTSQQAHEAFRDRLMEGGITDEALANELADEYIHRGRDSLTKWSGREDRMKDVENLIQHTNETGEPAYYIEADLRNLGGLNAFAGHTGADKHFKAIADIFHNAIKGLGSTATPYRHGGDEISATIAGDVSLDEVNAALANARKQVDDYVKENGLDSVPHTKLGRKAGVGLYAAAGEIRADDSVESALSRADRAVEQQKKGEGDVESEETTAAGRTTGDNEKSAEAGGVAERGGRKGQAEGDRGQGQKRGTKDAVHIEDGEQEAVTPTVIADAVEKGADKTNRPNPEIHKQLIADIEHRLGLAAELYKTGLDPDGLLKPTEISESSYDFVTFKVPGDGKFKVRNRVDNLEKFLKQVKRTPAFAGKQPNPPSSGLRLGPISETIKEFSESEDPDDIKNAIELLRLQGKKDETGPLVEKLRSLGVEAEHEVTPADEYKPKKLSASELGVSNKSNRKWFPVDLNGDVAWTTGIILDVTQPPVKKKMVDIPYDKGDARVQAAMDRLRGGDNIELLMDAGSRIPGYDKKETKAEFLGAVGGTVLFRLNGNLYYYDSTFYNYFANKYPDATTYISGGTDNLIFEVNNKFVGMLAGFREDKVEAGVKDAAKSLLAPQETTAEPKPSVKAEAPPKKQQAGEVTPETVKPDEQAESAKESTSEQQDDLADLPIKISLDDIDFEKAKEAYRGISMTPEKRARQEQEGYVKAVEAAYKQFADKAKTDKQKEALKHGLEMYRDTYLRLNASLLAAKSRTMSVMVTGPSKFPTAKNNKRLNTEDKRLSEFVEGEKRARLRIGELVEAAKTPEQKADDRWSKVRKDIIGSLGVIHDIDVNGAKGADRALFASSLAGQLKRLHKNGEQELVNRALDLIEEAQAKWDKPAITPRHSIWKLRTETKAQPQASSESTPYTEKRHKETIRAIRNGTISLDDYKQAFADFLASEDEMRAELKKKTVEQLTGKKSVSGYTKAQIINSIIERRMRSYVLSDGFMWSPLTEKYRDAVKRLVESTTEADLKEHAARKKAEKEETLKALNNPETLKEFNTFIAYKGEGALSDEQRATHDKLLAQQSKAAEAARTERKTAAKVESTQRAVGDDLASELKETKHTKHGYDLFVIQLADRVDKDTYRSILAQAKQLGGWYSKFRGNGAIPGFQFKDRESAEQFQKLIAGDEQAADAVVEKAVERVEKKLDAKQQKAANRLRQQAERLNDKAEEALNAERKTNTPKRAREAARADANARADQALAKTMLNLAEAIETGATEFLQNISTKAHIEELDSHARSAMRRWEWETKALYDEHRTPDVEHIAHARIPDIHDVLPEDVSDIANTLEKINGGKQLAARLRKQKFLGLDDAEKAVRLIRRHGDKHTGWQLEGALKHIKRLQTMGITNDAELRTALREYLQYKEARAAEDPIKKLERELVGTNPGVDFFPTPPALAKRLVEEADIQPGMTVLEPSAGKGDIADAVKEAVLDADIEAVEMSSTLRNILQAKGYNVTSTDFMTHDGEYDRIVMNPPFSDGMDAEHVQHAYDMLKPGGKLVAITGEGIFFRNDKKSKAFRDWLDSVDGTSEKLPEGSFKSSFRPTGVATRLVVIEKPANIDREAIINQVLQAMRKPLPNIVEVFELKGSDGKWYRGTGFPLGVSSTGEKRSVGFSIEKEGVHYGAIAKTREELLSKHERLEAKNEKENRAALEERTDKELLDAADYWLGKNKPKYSRTPNEGITAAAVRDALNLSPQAKQKLLNSQRVRIVQSVSDIPGTHPDDVAGAYHDGAIWLVADNLTPQDAYAVLLHEVVHAELAKLPEFQKILADVEAGIKRGGRPFVEARNTVPRGTPAEHVIEETLAYLVQNNPRLPVVRRLIAAIRAALRKLGLVENYTADDMVRLAHVALKRMAGGNPTTRAGDALYNRADRTSFQGRDTDTLPQAAQQAMAALNRVWTGDRLESVAKAKRELRGNRDAIDWLETNHEKIIATDAGMYSQAEQTKTPAFKRWFGDSVVTVDGKPGSEPLVVYHGTNKEFNVFKESKDGMGFHFGTSKAANDVFASTQDDNKDSANIIPAYLSIKNPLRLPDMGFWVASDVAAAAVKADTRINIKKSRFLGDEFYRIEDIVSAIKKAGYDGIVYENKYEDIGSDAFIAFEPKQIKSAIGNQSTFDSRNPDIRYSRRANTPDDAESLLREFDSAYKAAPRLQDSAYKSWDSVKNMARNKRRAWLGLLTRQQIVDVGKDVQPQAELFERLARQKDADENQLVQEHADILKTWSKRISRFAGRKDNAQMALLARTMHEATIAGFDPDKDSASTPDEKRLARAWAALDAGSKQLYRDVRDAYSKRRDELEMALAIRIAGLDPLDKTLPKTLAGMYERAFNKLQQDAQDGTTPSRRQTLAMLRASMESNRVKGPYFPLSRFGDYYITAEKAGEEKQFLMTESPAEWRRMQKELKAEGWTVTAGKKIENLATEMGPGINFMQDVFNIVEGSDASIDEATMKAMKDDLWQMYLRTLPDQSIRKHYIHRQNRRGFSQDAFRAFAHHTGHSSKQIARLRYSGALGDTLDAMKANIEGNSDPEKASDIADALNKSYQWMMAPNTARWAQRATSLGFAWYLGISPAAAAINLTQTPIVTFPVLSARYGTAKAGRELTRALKDYSANIRPGKWDAFLSRSGDLGRALKELEDSGAIDRTLTLSMLGMDSENVDLVKTQSSMMRTIGWFFHQAERANREITAIAAYRLARDAGRNHDQAVQAAYNAIYESHFDYSSGNRAQFMRGNTARVLLLFRQFSQNMIYTLWRNAQQSLKGASPEARKEARKKLGGILGMTAVFSGVMGLPLMSSALWVAQAAHDMFSDDDDEEWDAELALRQQLSEWFGEAGGSAVARGALGAGIGSRTGLNDLILRSPDRDLEGRALAAYYLEQAAGPLAGIGINAFRGAELMSQGQLYRGIEAMTPKAVKDALRTVRYGSEGVQSLRGDPIVARDDLSYWELFMQLNGLAPHEIIERYEQNNNLKRLEQKILNRRRSILNAYYMAWRDKDREGMREARQKMAGFNKAYPQARITPQSVSRSFKARERASRENQDGMFYNKSLRPLLQEQRYAA